MEAKKSSKANLENRKGLYIEIGLVVVMAIALVAFNIKSYDMEKVEITQRTAADEIEETILQTQVEELPPPPEPEVQIEVTEFHEIEDDQQSDNLAGPIDMSDDANRAQEEYIAPVEEAPEEEVKEEEILVFVDEMAEFPGGPAEMMKFLRENVKYPVAAKEAGIEGKVAVQFVVEKDGSVSNVIIKKDIGGGCGQEAVRVVKSMPKWKPAKNGVRTVRSYFTLPVSFILR